jgi:hypothetical protein
LLHLHSSTYVARQAFLPQKFSGVIHRSPLATSNPHPNPGQSGQARPKPATHANIPHLHKSQNIPIYVKNFKSSILRPKLEQPCLVGSGPPMLVYGEPS